MPAFAHSWPLWPYSLVSSASTRRLGTYTGLALQRWTRTTIRVSPSNLKPMVWKMGQVLSRTMRITPVATLFIAASLGAVIWLGAPVAIGRALKPLEALIIAAVVLVLLAWWRGRRIRRKRAQTESMRDSALW